ncbi:MAG: alpha/beta hydrolase-fold protein [Ferruginibacter sp.]
MKSFHLVFMTIVISLSSFAQSSDDTLIPKTMEGVKAMKFTSSVNHHDYVIFVSLPASYNDSNKKTYPVMYTLDAQWSFPYALQAQGSLLYDNLVPEMIYVGIAFPQNWFANRNRDFTPTNTDFDSASGGAPAFLEMIKKEIIPIIDSTYRTDKKNNGITGGSSAGLFVLYTLFQQPSPFNRFMANSPSLWYDNLLMLKIEKEYLAKSHKLNAKLFLSSGGYEEENDPPVFEDFIAQLQSSHYVGLEMENLVIEKTGHLTAGFYAIIRGMQYIYSKPDILLDTILLNEYAGHYEHDIAFVRKGKSLYFSGFGKQTKLNAETDKTFYNKGVNGIAEFIRDGKGKITGVEFNSADTKGAFAKRIE